jgi:hypothetical protein
MSDILIDRDTLQRLLDSHLDLEAEARGFRTLRYRAGIKNPGAVLRYAEAHKAAVDEQRSQIEGTYLMLRDALSAGDEDRARALLSSLFPRR